MERRPNAYMFRCEPTGKVAGYGVCLFIVKAHLEKRLKGFEDCAGCLAAKTCPALKMIKEEEKADREIYWAPYPTEPVRTRTIVQPRAATTSPFKGMGDDSLEVIPTRLKKTAKPRPKKEVTSDFENASYADAINKAMKKQAPSEKKPAAKPETSGMSLLERARQLKKEKEKC